MSNHKHTPGPWAVEQITNEDDEQLLFVRATIEDPELGWKPIIATPLDIDCDEVSNIAVDGDFAICAEAEESHANMHLIAAAPELLEVYESCAEDLAFSEENCDKELRQQLLSVIKKAKGE